MDKNIKTALIIGGVILAVLVILPLVFGLIAGWQGYGYGMMGPWMMGGFGMMGFMSIFWIAALGLIVWLVVAAVRRPSDSHSSAGSGSALEVLKKRYARGEIGKEEYEEKKKDLDRIEEARETCYIERNSLRFLFYVGCMLCEHRRNRVWQKNVSV